MRLLAVELSRFRSRRAIVLLSLATILVAVVLLGATAWDTRPLTEADRSDAAAQAELEGTRPELQQEVRACERDPTGFLGPDASPDDCASTMIPGPDAYYPREALELGEVLENQGTGLALVVAGLMVMAGCTFAGADWSSGSLTNQLIFEPRRTRVWLSKGAAVVIGSGVVTLAVLSGFWLAAGLLTQARDLSVPSSEVNEVVWHVARAVALSMGAGLGAFALTMAFRHTVATLALLFVYSVGGEIAVNLLPFEGAGRWSVGNNVFGWLSEGHRYFDSTISCAPGERCSSMQTVSQLEAGTFLGILLAVAVTVSLVWFRRRDV